MARVSGRSVCAAKKLNVTVSLSPAKRLPLIGRTSNNDVSSTMLFQLKDSNERKRTDLNFGISSNGNVKGDRSHLLFEFHECAFDSFARIQNPSKAKWFSYFEKERTCDSLNLSSGRVMMPMRFTESERPNSG